MVLVGKVNKDIVLRINRHGQPAVGLCGDDGAAVPRRAARPAPGGEDIGFVGRIERVDVDVLNHIAAGLHPGDRVGRRRPRGQLLQRQRRRGGRRGGARARRLQGHLPDRRRRLAARPGRPRRRSSARRAPTRSRRRSTASPAACGPKLEACVDAIHGGVSSAHIVDGRVAALAAARAVHRRRHRHEDQARAYEPRRAAGARARPRRSRTYARLPVEFVRGEGARLWDAEGNEYLDFLAGIAVGEPRPLPPARRRGGPRAGRAADPRRQPLLHRAGDAAGRSAWPSARWAARCSSATPAPRPTRRRSSSRARRSRGGDIVVVARRLPRPHVRRAVGDAAGVQAGAVRAARARASSPSRRPPRRSPRRSTTQHRGGAARADPGRDRRPRARRRGAARRARGLRRARRGADLRRDPVRAWGAPARCGPTSRPASCPTR